MMTFEPYLLTADDMLDTCPEHDAEAKKEYDFGMNDATVTTFRCGCAACTNHGTDEAILYPGYQMAAGMARMIVAGERAFTHRYGF